MPIKLRRDPLRPILQSALYIIALLATLPAIAERPLLQMQTGHTGQVERVVYSESQSGRTSSSRYFTFHQKEKRLCISAQSVISPA
jgi:hypothetical protein